MAGSTLTGRRGGIYHLGPTGHRVSGPAPDEKSIRTPTKVSIGEGRITRLVDAVKRSSAKDTPPLAIRVAVLKGERLLKDARAHLTPMKEAHSDAIEKYLAPLRKSVDPPDYAPLKKMAHEQYVRDVKPTIEKLEKHAEALKNDPYALYVYRREVEKLHNRLSPSFLDNQHSMSPHLEKKTAEARDAYAKQHADPVVAKMEIPASVRKLNQLEAMLEIAKQPRVSPEAREHAAKTIGHLEGDERSALGSYTSGQYREIKAYQRGDLSSHKVAAEHARVMGEYADDPRDVKRRGRVGGGISRDTAALEALVDRLPPTPCTVFRGLHDVSPANFNKWLTQTHFATDSFTSTSHSNGLAVDFASKGTDRTNSILLVMKQKSGRLIESASYLPAENEVLLKKGTRFKITDRAVRDDGMLIVHVEEHD